MNIIGKLTASGIVVGSGLPSGATPNQQLVTDSNGEAVWADRTHYKHIGMAEMLSETTFTANEMADDGIPIIHLNYYPQPGDVYNVAYNSIVYSCVAKPLPVENGIEAIYFGNGEQVGMPASAEPFTVVLVTDASAAQIIGAAGILAPLDNNWPVTISISGEREVIKTLDPEYLPAGAVIPQITITHDDDSDTYAVDYPFNLAWAMTDAQLGAAITIKTATQSLSVRNVARATFIDKMLVLRYAPFEDLANQYVERCLVWSAGGVVHDPLADVRHYNIRIDDSNDEPTGFKFTGTTLRVAEYIPSIHTASPGQTVVVKTVDHFGVPTAWEAVDISGGSAATGSINLADTVTGQIYTLSVADGDLQISEAAEPAVAQSLNTVSMTDRITGAAYNLYVADGKLTLTEVES